MIKIIQRRKIWFAFSSSLVIISIAALALWGLKLGIDFTGGTLLEVGFNEGNLTNDEIKETLKDFDLGDINVQFSSEGTAFLRMKDVDEDTHQKVLTALNDKVASKLGVSAINDSSVETSSEGVSIQAVGEDGADADVTVEPASGENPEAVSAVTETTERKYVSEKRFDSIGPSIGNELKTNTAWAILIALIAIGLYIAWAFRKVSYPVSSSKYSVAAIVALFHDIIITMGAFSILGHFYGVEVGITFVAALLAILGYSINDTIVVFDRTRENLLRSHINDFEEVVNRSVNETFVRSLNTSFTTLLTLFALYLFGGSSISYFVLALIIGISFGTYSSIFVASALIVSWQKFDMKKKQTAR